jgi:hypothetical protein
MGIGGITGKTFAHGRTGEKVGRALAELPDRQEWLESPRFPRRFGGRMVCPDHVFFQTQRTNQSLVRGGCRFILTP